MSSQERSEQLSPAAEAFAAFLDRRESGGDVDFEAFCAERPELAPKLRRLHERWQLFDRALEGEDRGLTLTQRLSDEFGADSDPGITLGSDAPAPGENAADTLVEELRRQVPQTQRYEVRGEVARGGMGAILEVWDRELRRSLAMKVLLGGSVTGDPGSSSRVDARSLSRFLEEAQITGQLEHPGIVPVHEVGLDAGGRIYFTMPLVRGRNLQEIIRLMRSGEEGWTLTRVLGVIVRVCEAVGYAHSLRVIHRDLKPDNVMVGPFGETYVMDWGLARVIGDDATPQTVRREVAKHAAGSPLMTAEGDVVGTPCYMAPEQAKGTLSDVGVTSDVYAIGAMLYQALTGERPYAAGDSSPSPAEVLDAVRNQPPQPVHELDPAVPAELEAICEMAMARDPKRRYATTMELAEELRAFLEMRVVRAYRTGPAVELRKWMVRNRKLAIAIASGVLALVAGFVVSTLLFVESRANEADALAQKTRADDKARAASLAAEAEAAALAKVLRLADTKSLEQLRTRAEALWPAHPQNEQAYEDWLEEATALYARLGDVHRPTLEEMHTIEPQADGRWVYSDFETQWQHDVLAQLIEDLGAFGAPETGLISDVESRLTFASTVLERTVNGPEPAARWREAIAAIRDASVCPPYRGLVIKPQVGLVPIGRDPRSGLWEFAHVQTGRVPVRDPDNHELRMMAKSALVFVLLPGGTYMMGAQANDATGPNYDPEADPDEAPVHEVEVQPFFISKYEMTQAQWERFHGVNPSFYKPGLKVKDRVVTAIHPVERVDWYGCMRTLERLGLMLPSEEQWEYAARGGTETPWSSGFERDTLIGATNLADQALARAGARIDRIRDWPELDDGWATHAPVNWFRPNPFGLHNVHGNVWEWTSSESRKYGLPPPDPTDNKERVRAPLIMMRGGSFGRTSHAARSSFRTNYAPDYRDGYAGLRPARSLDR